MNQLRKIFLVRATTRTFPPVVMCIEGINCLIFATAILTSDVMDPLGTGGGDPEAPRAGEEADGPVG